MRVIQPGEEDSTELSVSPLSGFPELIEGLADAYLAIGGAFNEDGGVRIVWDTVEE